MKTINLPALVLVCLIFWLPVTINAQSIPLEPKDHYYAIEINGVLCGYSHEIIKPVKKKGKNLLDIKADVKILQTLLGGSADLEIKSYKLVDAESGNFINLDSEIIQGGLTMGSSMEVKGEQIIFTNKMSGEVKEIPLEEDLILDNGSYYSFVLRDLSNDWLDKDYKTIDPMEGKIDTRHIKFEGKEEIELNGHTYNTLKLKENFKSSGVSADLWIDENTGYVLRRDFVTGRSIYLADKSVTKKIQVAKLDDDIFAKVDVVIPDILKLSYIKVKAEMRSPGDPITVDSLNYPGQKFTGTVEDNYINGVFEISHAKYDGAEAPAFPFDYSKSEDLKKYLEPENFIESDDKDLIAKAQEITEGAKDSWEAATRITRWVSDNISYAIPGGITARKTLNERNGECGAHSRLVAALCRGVGIPAKFVIGCMYSNTYGGTFGQHAWNEVYMGDAGWIPVDATATEIDYIDSGHIRLGEKNSFTPDKMEILDYKIDSGNGLIEEIPEKYEKFVGNYIGPGSVKPFRVSYKNNGLAVAIPDQMEIELNEPDEKDHWYAKITNQLFFSFVDDGSDLSPYMHLHQLTSVPKTAEADSIGEEVPEKFHPYLGKYYFAALQDHITVVFNDSTLAVNDPTHAGLISLQPPDENGKWMDQFDKNGLIFNFSDEGKVTGITVVSEHVFEREW